MIRNISKKLLLILFIIIGVNASYGQFRYAGIVGGALTNLHFKQDLAPVNQVGGAQAGVQGELMFPGIGFGMDLGLMYNLAGANVDLGDKPIWSSQGYGKERIALHQLVLPFHLRFKWTRLNGLEEIIAPFAYGGPDFSILLAHGHCDAMKYAGGDLGLTAGIGAEIFRKWQISGSYTWGMTYVLKTQLLQDYSARSRQWTIRLAYFF